MDEYLQTNTDYVINPSGACILIGDLHGSLERLSDLFPRLEAEVTERLGAASWAHATLVFLGDYIDKGTQSRAVIDHLVALERSLLPGQRPLFLMGNHDFSLMAFLGLIPRASLTLPHPLSAELGDAFDASFYESRGETLWRSDSDKSFNNDSNDNNVEKNTNVGKFFSPSKHENELTSKHESELTSEKVSTWEEMHIQGRRYGVPGSYFTVGPTFESYGCSCVSRAELLANMPAEHTEFFRSLRMIQILRMPGRGHIICVHAGLAEGRPAVEQLELLRAANCGVSWDELISGVEGVRTPPRELQRPDVLVASGHHAILSVADYPSRAIVDTSEAGYLSALVLPPKEVLDTKTKREIEKIMDIDFSDDQVFAVDDMRYGSFIVQSAKFPYPHK